MNKLERHYLLRQIFRDMSVVPTAVLQERLGHISRATLTRYLNELSEIIKCPVVYDRDAGGYRLLVGTTTGRGELPGLWFSAEEIHALLTMHHLLQELGGGGLLGPHLAPLKQRITSLLGAATNSVQEVTRRVHLETVAARRFRLEHFEAVGAALLRRQRIDIDYRARSNNRSSRRLVSPQRLTHYRDNWYLDAWCHQAEDLRRFALDAIQRVTVLSTPAVDMDEAQLEHRLASGYGAFAGDILHWATLQFSPERSRWVAEEIWHRDQQGMLLPDGSYNLRLPYNHAQELVMDILRHGRHVTVLSPPELIAAVRDELQHASKIYAGCSGFKHEGENNAGG